MNPIPSLRAPLLAVTLALLAPIAATAAPTCKPGLTALDLPDGSHYCGQMKNGKVHGQGRIDWDENRYYEGGFVRGVIEGKGKMVNRDKKGDYVYEGQFSRGQMHGKGKLAREDKFVYEGEFVLDQMEGMGKVTVEADGGRYVYEGEFKDNGPNGQGRLKEANGRLIEGRFERAAPVGKVIVTWPSGDRYEGGWRYGPNGEGVWNRADKAVLRGTFVNRVFLHHGGTEFEGDATITYPDGSVYTGAVFDKRAHGQGTLRRPNGEVYVGHFADDQFDGKGTLTRADGTAQTGWWLAGGYRGTQGIDIPGDVTLDDTPELAASNAEAALYNQQALLQEQFDQLQPSPANGPTQMYALLVAGDGTRQEVFRREVAWVDAFLAQRFGTRGRSVSLVNSRSSVGQLPLATTHSIDLALQALAQKMNRERDLLFIYITSHGSQDHGLALGLRGLELPRLPAKRLADMLESSGIRNRIVVISACSLGGFVPLLQGERTWVITAARAECASFNDYADEDNFTHFGRALFKESLPAAPTLSAAFEQADRLVTEWETRDAEKRHPQPRRDTGGAAAADASEPQDIQRSQPQSTVSPAFRAEVDAWFQAHPGPATP